MDYPAVPAGASLRDRIQAHYLWLTGNADYLLFTKGVSVGVISDCFTKLLALDLAREKQAGDGDAAAKFQEIQGMLTEEAEELPTDQTLGGAIG